MASGGRSACLARRSSRVRSRAGTQTPAWTLRPSRGSGDRRGMKRRRFRVCLVSRQASEQRDCHSRETPGRLVRLAVWQGQNADVVDGTGASLDSAKRKVPSVWRERRVYVALDTRRRGSRRAHTLSSFDREQVHACDGVRLVGAADDGEASVRRPRGPRTLRQSSFESPLR